MNTQYIQSYKEPVEKYSQGGSQLVYQQQERIQENFTYSQPHELGRMGGDPSGGYFRLASVTNREAPQTQFIQGGQIQQIQQLQYNQLSPLQENLIQGGVPNEINQNFIIQQGPPGFEIQGMNSLPSGIASVGHRRRYSDAFSPGRPATGGSVQYITAGQEPLAQQFIIQGQPQFIEQAPLQEQIFVQREYLPQQQMVQQQMVQQQIPQQQMPQQQIQQQYGQTMLRSQTLGMEGAQYSAGNRNSYGLGGMSNSGVFGDRPPVQQQNRQAGWGNDDPLPRHSSQKSMFNRDAKGIFILGKGRLGLDDEKKMKEDWNAVDSDTDLGKGKKKGGISKNQKKDQFDSTRGGVTKPINPMSRSLTQSFFGEDPYSRSNTRNPNMVSSQIFLQQAQPQPQTQDPFLVNSQRIIIGGEQQPQQNVIYIQRPQEEFAPQMRAQGAPEYFVQREVQPQQNQLLIQGQQGPQIREYMTVVNPLERDAVYGRVQDQYALGLVQAGPQMIIPQDNIQYIETPQGIQYLNQVENVNYVIGNNRQIQENVQYVLAQPQPQAQPQLQQQQIFQQQQQQQQQQQYQQQFQQQQYQQIPQQFYSGGGSENVQYVTRTVVNSEPVTFVRREIGGLEGMQTQYSQHLQSASNNANSQLLSSPSTSGNKGGYPMLFGSQVLSQTGNTQGY